MSTKKEEKAAFEELKKEFPGDSVSVQLHYETWREEPNYYAYAESVGSTITENHPTVDSAINSIIRRKEEREKEENAKAD